VNAAPLIPLPGNLSLWCVALAWILAQFIKFAATLARERRVDFAYFVSTGGMPSAHSASVSALAVSAGLAEGFESTFFAIAVVVALVVMFDAQSVRRAAGHQAALLNQMIAELFKDRHFSHGKLKELLGHTPLEVFAGLAIGGAVAFTVHVLAGGLSF
jgi:acid phosphatase family membrane protein YuiD